MRAVERALSGAFLWLLAPVTALCLVAPRPATGLTELERGAALALPYFSGPGEETHLTIFNGLDDTVLRVVAIDGDPGSSFDQSSFRCPLTGRESTRLRIRSQGDGTAEITAECADLAAPMDPDVEVVTPVPGEQGVVFVALEDPVSGDAINTNAIAGEATIFDFAEGTQASVDAVTIEGPVPVLGDEDDIFFFDDDEYQQPASSYFGEFEAPDDDRETHLVVFNFDGTTGAGAPSGSLDISFSNGQGNLFAAQHSFAGFERVALTSIDPRFSAAFLGSEAGTIELFGRLQIRSDGHDDLASIGDGDGVRNTPFWAWMLRAEEIFSSDAGTTVNSAAGRLLSRSSSPLLPSGDDLFALRVTVDGDGDGIADAIDPLPDSFSSDFDDTPRGGMTTGTILDRGDQSLRVTDAPPPEGVRVRSDPGGGPAPAVLEVCGGAARVVVVTAGANGVVTCASVVLSVRAGLFELQFEIDGEPASVEVGAGNTLTYDPDTETVAADPGNADPLVLETPAGDVVLDPGDTLALGVEIDVRPESRRNVLLDVSRLPVVVAILGAADLDVGDVDAGSLGFGPGGALPTAPLEFPLVRRLLTRDVDGDGRDDLLLPFRFGDTGLPLGASTACLTGTVAGDPFLACDDAFVVDLQKIGCGLGFELALLLPPLWWLRRRRRLR